MLPKHSRLSRELFLATFKRSRRIRGVGFQLLYAPAPVFQVSVVVAKKIVPHAVGRNYIRRRVYTFLHFYTEKTSLQGRYIVMLSPESKKHSLEALLSSLAEILPQTLPHKPHSR